MKTIDWRIRNQDKYLKNLDFEKTQFYGDDHAHCEFCWAKFGKNDDDLKFGYNSTNNKYWICETCFKDFEKDFNFKEIDFRYHTKNEARNFHKNRKAFIIYKNTLEFLPFESEMSHFEYCSLKGIKKQEFNNLIRGYYLAGNLVFYKDNFVYDEILIQDSLNYINTISQILNQSTFNIYFGQIPEKNFKLDLFYGIFKDGKVIKNK